MLSIDQLNKNREDFITLVKSLETFKNHDTEGLIDCLDSSDFFYAPATSKYHGSYPGGLCEHSLRVYKTLCRLNETFACGYSDRTLKLVGLLHDLSKVDYYEEYSRNVKNAFGQWEQVKEYRIKDASSRQLGDKGVNAFLQVSKYFPLTEEETMALIYQYAGADKSECSEDVLSILDKYSLTALIHVADILSVYVEKEHE